MRPTCHLLPATLLLACSAGCTVRPPSHAPPRPAALDAAPAAAGAWNDRTLDPAALDVHYGRWEYGNKQGWVIVTPHFEIYTTVASKDLRDRLPYFYESCLRHFAAELGELPRPGKRMTTYVFGAPLEWKNKTREMLPGQAEAFMTLGRGGFTTRGISVLFDIGPDTFAIAAHEGWHQYTQSTFDHPLPVWLEEGIATYMEAISPGRTNRATTLRAWDNEERRATLRGAVRSRTLIPLEALLTRSPQSFLNDSKDELLVYYSQVWALAQFLVAGEDERYRPALENLLADAAAGRLEGRLARMRPDQRRRGRQMLSRNGPLVLQAYFNDDLDAFRREYLRFVAELAHRRGPRRRWSLDEGSPPGAGDDLVAAD